MELVAGAAGTWIGEPCSSTEAVRSVALLDQPILRVKDFLEAQNHGAHSEAVPGLGLFIDCKVVAQAIRLF